MAAQVVNQKTVKRATLKRVAKRRRIGGPGDGGFITNKIKVTIKNERS